MSKLIYKGSVESGHIECPTTGRRFEFRRGQTIDVPANIAAAVGYQSPSEWTLDAEASALVAARVKKEKEDAEAKAKAESDAKAKPTTAPKGGE